MDENFFTEMIKRYGQAWDHYDLQTILSYYHTPCFIYKSQMLFANLTEEVKIRYFTDLLDNYRQQGYDKAETPNIEIQLLGTDSALVTVEWLCKRANGTIAFDFWDTYHFIRVNDSWKILGDTVYDK
jgi:NTF2-like protein (DUF6841)